MSVSPHTKSFTIAIYYIGGNNVSMKILKHFFFLSFMLPIWAFGVIGVWVLIYEPEPPIFEYWSDLFYFVFGIFLFGGCAIITFHFFVCEIRDLIKRIKKESFTPHGEMPYKDREPIKLISLPFLIASAVVILIFENWSFLARLWYG